MSLFFSSFFVDLKIYSQLQYSKTLIVFSLQFFRRRRKRRDQVAEEKGDKPQNFNLPQIPHCYSTAVSLAASSMAHKFSDGLSLGSIDADVSMRSEEETSISNQYNIHQTAQSGTLPSNPVEVDQHHTPQINALQENTPNPENTASHKPTRIHGLPQEERNEQYMYHPHHQTHPVGEGHLTQAVSATVSPEFRTATTQSHFDVPRHPNFSNISNYPSTLSQATSTHYTAHYSLGQAFSSTGSPLASHSQFNPHVGAQFPNQRPFNFTVNQLIQRPYPKM